MRLSNFRGFVASAGVALFTGIVTNPATAIPNTGSKLCWGGGLTSINPESCDGLLSAAGQPPQYTSCNRDQVVRDSYDLKYGNTKVATVRLYYSKSCDAVWANINSIDPTGSTRTIAAHVDRSASMGYPTVKEAPRGQGHDGHNSDTPMLGSDWSGLDQYSVAYHNCTKSTDNAGLVHYDCPGSGNSGYLGAVRACGDMWYKVAGPGNPPEVHIGGCTKADDVLCATSGHYNPFDPQGSVNSCGGWERPY